MTIGRFVRKILGKNFGKVGKVYRAIFVDLSAVADAIDPYIPNGSVIIDVGGGDGQLLNHLLSRRRDLKIEMLDLSPSIGGGIQEVYLQQVEMYPETGMAKFSIPSNEKPLVVLISDVIHHVPVSGRKAFFSDLRKMTVSNHESTVIIKDVQPGHVRSFLGYLADRFVSGDKNVSLVGRNEIQKMMLECYEGNVTVTETNLFELDKPNFALVFTNK